MHQVVKRPAQTIAAEAQLGVLPLYHLVVLLDRDRSRSDVLADLTASGGQMPAPGGQRERVVVADHPLHFQQLLLPELMKHGFQNRKGEFQSFVEHGQRAGAVEPQDSAIPDR